MQGNGRARVLFVQRLKPSQNIDSAHLELCGVRFGLDSDVTV
jgi:hypothetical protein